MRTKRFVSHPAGRGKFDLAAGLWGTCMGDETGRGCREGKKRKLFAFSEGNNSIFLFKSQIYICIYIYRNVCIKIGTYLTAEMSMNCEENAKRKMFFLMFKTEKWTISNNMATYLWSENPNPTRPFCNEVKWFCFCGASAAVLGAA